MQKKNILPFIILGVILVLAIVGILIFDNTKDENSIENEDTQSKQVENVEETDISEEDTTDENIESTIDFIDSTIEDSNVDEDFDFDDDLENL